MDVLSCFPGTRNIHIYTILSVTYPAPISESRSLCSTEHASSRAARACPQSSTTLVCFVKENIQQRVRTRQLTRKGGIQPSSRLGGIYFPCLLQVQHRFLLRPLSSGSCVFSPPSANNALSTARRCDSLYVTRFVEDIDIHIQYMHTLYLISLF